MLTAKPILEASKLSRREFKRIVGASTEHIYTRINEPISLAKADLWCVRIGLHPYDVYGPEWFALCAT